MTATKQTNLSAIGMHFDNWQDAVEAAIATNQLMVTGEVRGGQLVQFNDTSGAQLNILAVEPFSTFVGFNSLSQTYAHVEMINDVLALCEIVDPSGAPLKTVTAHLAQGPLLADEPAQPWQQLTVAALADEASISVDAEDWQQQHPEAPLGAVESHGAAVISSGSGAQAPDASATFSGRVMQSTTLRNQLTGQEFHHVVLDSEFPLDVCIPAESLDKLPEKGEILHGSGTLTASILAPTGGCGCGSGGCGCGGHDHGSPAANSGGCGSGCGCGGH